MIAVRYIALVDQVCPEEVAEYVGVCLIVLEIVSITLSCKVSQLRPSNGLRLDRVG